MNGCYSPVTRADDRMNAAAVLQQMNQHIIQQWTNPLTCCSSRSISRERECFHLAPVRRLGRNPISHRNRKRETKVSTRDY